jgi:hypothetical protein
VRIVDVATGRFQEIAHDRAFTWSRQLRTAVTHLPSDRAYGIMNIFAFDTETQLPR